MRNMSRPGAAVVLILLVSASSPAYAYLDPGSGAMILQAMLAGIAGALAVLRLYWGRLRSWVRNFLGHGTQSTREGIDH